MKHNMLFASRWANGNMKAGNGLMSMSTLIFEHRFKDNSKVKGKKFSQSSTFSCNMYEIKLKRKMNPNVNLNLQDR